MLKTRTQCALLLINQEGRLLLQLRDDKPTLEYPNCWGFFGGQAEDGETPEQTIIREISEELNYDLKNPEYLGNFGFEVYDQHVFYKIDPTLQLEDLNVMEGQRGGFFNLAEIRKLPLAFNVLEIVEAYFKKYPST